ncbi:hypothetical protein [Bradyrhizobium genosp. A]|uniref:hypothetical protein n=1 Tax=Bradyrhizobium genosp. A TaxID=83626 RepID=UPI003CE8987B
MFWIFLCCRREYLRKQRLAMIDLKPTNGRTTELIRLQFDLPPIAVNVTDGMATEMMSGFVPECQIKTGGVAGGPFWIVSDSSVTSTLERHSILEP